MSSSGAPFIRKRPANVCRKSCQRKPMRFASTTASSNQWRPFSRGSPVFADWNTRPLGPPLPCTTLRAAIATSFSGTCMGSSFFVRGIFSILTFPVYHVPCEPVLAALPKARVDRQVEVWQVRRPLALDHLAELLFLREAQKPYAIICLIWDSSTLSASGDLARRTLFFPVRTTSLSYHICSNFRTVVGQIGNVQYESQHAKLFCD